MARKLGKFLMYALATLVALVASVLVLIELALHMPAARELMRTEVNELASRALSAQVEIEKLDAASLFYVRGSGLSILRKQERVVSLDHFAIRLNPFALVTKQLSIRGAWLDNPDVDLDRLQLLLAENSKHEASEEKPSQKSGFGFSLHGLRISGGALETTQSGARVAISELTLLGDIEIGAALAARVPFVSLHVARKGEPVASLRGSQLRYAGDRISGKLHLRTQRGELVANAALGKPGKHGARRVDAHLYARGIAPEDLSALGFDVGFLRSPLELDLNANGTTRAGKIDLRLATDGGDVKLRGELREGDRFVATLASDRLDLNRVLTAGGELLSAKLELRGKFAHDFSAAELTLRLPKGRYGNSDLPETAINVGYQSEHGIALDRLDARLPQAKIELRAQARVPKNGAVEVSAAVHAEALESARFLQELVPELAGALDARASFSRSAAGELKAQLELSSKKLALGAMTSESLSLNARGTGKDLESLQLNALVRAHGLHLGRMDFAEAQVNLRADPRVYLANADFGDQGRLELRVDRNGASWLARGSGDVALGHDRRLKLAIADARYAQRTLSVGRVELALGDARLRLNGSAQLDGRVRAHAVLSVPDLGQIAELVTTEHVAGKVALRANASGTTKRPRIALDGEYSADRMFGLAKATLGLRARVDVASRKLELSAQANAKNTAASLELKSELAEAELSRAAFERGKHEVTLELGNLPLTDFTLFPSGKLRLASAELKGRLHAKGTLREPNLDLKLQSRMRFHGDKNDMQLAAQAGYGDSKASLDLSASDAQGPLFHSAMKTDLKPHGALAHSVDDLSNVLSKRSWDVDLWLRARRVDELPAVHAVPVQPSMFPWKLSATAKLSHKPHEEPKGQLDLEALFDPSREPLHAARCGTAGAPRVAMKVNMGDGTLGSKTVLEVAQKTELEITTHSPAPVDQWLGPSKPEPFDLVARFDRLRLAALPLVCDEVDGELSGAVELRRAITQAVTLKTELKARHVGWNLGPKFDAYFEAHADHNDVRAKADFKGGGGAATFVAKLPLDVKASVPMLRMDSPAQIEARFQEMSVQALLGGVPEVSADSGKLDGVVKIDGKLSDPALHGELALRNVSVTLGALGQRFEDVSGRILLDGHRFRLEETHVHDRGGRLVVSGELDLLGQDRIRAEVKADAHKYPMRRDGVVLGTIDGKIQLRADVQPKRTTLDIALRQAAIDLQQEDFGNVQSLKPNPDVRFLDSQANDAKLVADDDSETVIHIDASEPMWIRREDFSVQVSTKLTVVSQGDTPEITGTLKIERGVIQLIGQLFDIERGSIEFSGGHAIEPTLDLTAKRNLPGGGSVTVQAEGRMHEPNLTFLVDDRASTPEQALAALSGSGASSASMQSELGSVATGMAAGVLTMGARRQLGDWVPMLAVESGANETRLRAGVEARRLIPKFLRKLVVDAYVEGMVSSVQDPNETESSAQQNSQTQASVLLELRFPHSLIGEAQYGPGQRWSADLSWEP